MSARHERHEYNTSAKRVRHECDTSQTRATQLRLECYTNNASATRVKNFDFHNITNDFQTPILAIWQMKDYNERNNFILRTIFWKCIVPMPKCVWKVHHRNGARL